MHNRCKHFVMPLAALVITGTALTLSGAQSTPPGSTPPIYEPPAPEKPRQDDDDRPRGDRDKDKKEKERDKSTGVGQKVSKGELDALTRDWPQTSRKALNQMVEKYGLPDEATPSVACWKNNGPWHSTKVFGQETRHNFPVSHVDVLEQCVEHRVPSDKADDILAFDGSITIKRTEGLMSACCDREEHNILALNLASEINAGTKTIFKAREELTQAAALIKDGKPPENAQRLMLDGSAGSTADPDQPMSEDYKPPKGTNEGDDRKDRKDRDD